jgi:hypothetical protein
MTKDETTLIVVAAGAAFLFWWYRKAHPPAMSALGVQGGAVTGYVRTGADPATGASSWGDCLCPGGESGTYAACGCDEEGAQLPEGPLDYDGSLYTNRDGNELEPLGALGSRIAMWEGDV